MTSTPTRTEHDTMGPVEVPQDRLWGAQTQRSLEYFRISEERMPLPVIHALAQIKKAAAKVNVDLGVLAPEIGAAIVQAADEVLQGRHDAEFPLSVWQTGSGTQSNMNVNEVLANRASELLGGQRGPQRLVHPNDHVNLSQSSNDAFPTAMSLAALDAVQHHVIPSVRSLCESLRRKANEFADVVKIGRTHLMDATPLTLGQEMSGWVRQLEQGIVHLQSAVPHLSELALGGTAVGTGLNAPPGFAERVAERLARQSSHALISAPNKFEALAAHDALVFAHGALKTLAASLVKIANDVRWLASGPRSGIGELTIPENEPGSSIMPGKVNPTQSEALTMACAQVFGNDVTINFAGASGNFQLNVYKPVLINAFLYSCRLLADGSDSFRRHCADGLQASLPRIREHLERSLMLVTALSPHIGYEAAARIAKKAHAEGTSLREAALALGLLTAEDFDRWVQPDAMLGR
ncbi:MAG TPA: class II fumarate hydratase [Polyangiaceae bacterium]|nr:class II fumarate hydratase [Polyangiaceae bacterium]